MYAFDVHNADDETLLAQVLAASGGYHKARRQAGQLLKRFGSLSAALAAPQSEICRALGEGSEPCAERVKALHQLVVGTLRAAVVDRPVMGSITALHDYLRARLAHEPREQVRILYLDARCHLIADELAGQGTVDHAPVYPREVVRRALELGAKSLVIVHNHPSGDPAPSWGDIQMTERIYAACRALELELIDHLIVARRVITSFKAEGLLGKPASAWRPPPKKVAGRRASGS